MKIDEYKEQIVEEALEAFYKKLLGIERDHAGDYGPRTSAILLLKRKYDNKLSLGKWLGIES